MTEVAVTCSATNFNSCHAVADITVLSNGIKVGGLHKARPARSRIELGVAREEQRSASGAMILAGRLVAIIFAGERRLGAALTQYTVLLGRQASLPFRVGQFDLFHFR